MDDGVHFIGRKVTMNRRSMLKLSGVAGVGALTLGAGKCGGQSIETEVAIIQSTALALKSLLPAQSTLLDKVGKLASDFNVAYKRGDFVSAKATFESLDTDIQTLIADVGGASPRVVFLVALVGVALHAVASLLASQSTSKLAAMAGPMTVNRVQQLGSAAAAAKMLEAAKQ